MLLIFLINGFSIQSQTVTFYNPDPKTKLADAEKLYQQGLYEECTASVQKLLNNRDLARKDREHALELLTKAYTEIPDELQARRSAEVLLHKYPHYELNEDDNFESYNRLIRKYKIHPALSLGIRNVILWTGFNTTKVFSLPDGSLNSEPYGAGAYFFSYYGWAEVEFDRNISLNADLMWWTSYYYKSYSREPDLDLYYQEWPEFVEIPVYAKKYFTIAKNLKPYVASGLGALYLTKTTANVSKTDNAANMTYYVNGINVIEARNRLNFEWLAGAGIGYRIKNVGLYLDLRYYLGLTSLANPGNGRQKEFLLNDYYYQDNELKMNKFEMGASISYTFINSIKRK
ncbi:MAG TPA: porin family protein [Bacteroidales bacterium]|nr:porin family protein [Bacteroidales bacterium]